MDPVFFSLHTHTHIRDQPKWLSAINECWHTMDHVSSKAGLMDTCCVHPGLWIFARPLGRWGFTSSGPATGVKRPRLLGTGHNGLSLCCPSVAPVVRSFWNHTSTMSWKLSFQNGKQHRTEKGITVVLLVFSSYNLMFKLVKQKWIWIWQRLVYFYFFWQGYI